VLAKRSDITTKPRSLFNSHDFSKFRTDIPISYSFGRNDKARPLRLCASQSDRLDSLFCVLCIAMLKNLCSLRKFSGGPWLSKTGICSRQDAKNAKSGSLIFFAAFAPLREIFRVLDAAQPR
jgi:hypothetical protein